MQPEKDENTSAPETAVVPDALPVDPQKPVAVDSSNSSSYSSDDDFIKDEAPDDSNADYDSDTKPFDDEENTLAPVLSPEVERRSFFAKHKILILVSVVLLLFAAMTASYFVMNGSNDDPVATTTQKKAVVLLGAEASVVDGVAEVSKDGKTWTVLKVGDAVVVGQSVRTSSDGRVVIALDDGSALRLNTSSLVKVVSLESANVRFSNESGEVYARVVPSNRTFVVAVNNETYTAKGTAYKTINREQIQGVEVYHSAVAVGIAKTDVSEGKRYYQANTDVALVKKTTDIPTDQLSSDVFLAWNLEQDKKTTEYADKLGYLAILEQKKAELAQKAASATQPVAAPTGTTGIKLTATKVDTGIKLNWTLNGVTAEKGFKIVMGKSANPTFGVDSATYVSSSTTRSYTWTLKDGKTYNFRVCTYTGDSCTNYSNNASAVAPKYSATYPTPSGSLSLLQVGGKNVEWELNGSAPNGYKLVWSTSENPVYPGSSAVFYDKGASNGAIGASADGTYYVRVCMYTGSGCINYSNQITIKLE
jgi:hypothetical protein